MLSAIDQSFVASGARSRSTPTQAPSNIQVLVATSELSKRKGLARCFSGKAGFAVIRCRSSLDDIISCCRRLCPCVLIIGQETMEGADLAEFIRKVKFGRGVQILVAGQQPIRETVQSILRAGCTGFLESGCSNYLLRNVVRSGDGRGPC